MIRLASLVFGLLMGIAAITGDAVAQDSAESAPESKSKPLPWVTEAVEAPRVEYRVFESASVASKVSFHIYKPASYETESDKRFPVIYWLHGSGGGMQGIPRVAKIFDDSIAAGKIPACMVVFVNGLPNGMYIDWKNGEAPVESMIMKDLIPYIDSNFRTIAGREGRVLDGFSMGGYGAARLGFSYPDMFCAISMMGAGPMQTTLVNTPRMGPKGRDEIMKKVYGDDQAFFLAQSPWMLAERHAARLREGMLMRLVIGDRDETLPANRLFHTRLEELKIPHAWRVLPGVDHNPLRTIAALGEEMWSFYREAFSPPAPKPVETPQP